MEVTETEKPSITEFSEVKVEESATPKDGEEPFDYDYIMEHHLGQMGKYQLAVFLLLCLPSLLPGPVVMSYTFTGAVPEYRYTAIAVHYIFFHSLHMNR